MGIIFGKSEGPAVDTITAIIGAFGKYQFILCFFIFMSKVFIAFHQMAIIFLNPRISFFCNEVKNACPCDTPIYDKSLFSRTMTTEWNLICEKSMMGNMQQSIFQMGVLVGSVAFGMASDRYGRKKPLLVAVLMQLSCGIAAALVRDYWVFSIFRHLVGWSVGGTMVTTFVILLEFVGTQHREVLSALYQMPFNAGHLLLPVIAYFVRDFYNYQMALSAPAVVMLTYFWAPETPRWLIAVNRTEEAITILTRAAEVNERPTETIRAQVEAYQATVNANSTKKGTIVDLFRTPNIRKNIICMSINWMACSYCFYGVSQYVGQLSGDAFLNVGASATVTMMGTLSSIPLMKVMGRRTILIVANGIAATCLLLLGILPNTKGLFSVVLAIIGQVMSFVVFVVVYLYTSELFPTVVRNAAVGLSSSCARVGSILAPFVIDLKRFGDWCPPVVFAILPGIACLVSFLMPETKGCRLMNTVEEGEAFGRETETS